jgi:hypothetical protein
MNNTVTELKNLASELETLAKEVLARLDNGTDLFVPVSEIVTNQAKLIFALGEHATLSQKSSRKTRTTRVVSHGNNLNKHNVRDSLGRFTRV